MKAVYRHKHSGDIFAIETDNEGIVISTCSFKATEIEFFMEQLAAEMENMIREELKLKPINIQRPKNSK